MSEYRFLNPYNFVRCLDVPENKECKEAPKTKILGRCAPPPHDRFVGLTGRIACELEAKTPIFISDSEFVEGAEHKSYRRSEEHTSELQSRPHLVCRLLLEK